MARCDPKNIMSIILLEHPRPRTPERYEAVVNTPLSSCLMTGYIASTIKSGHHEVEVVDANLHGWTFYETIKVLEKKSFRLLGVHLVYLWEDSEDVFEMLLSLRKNGLDAHINLFGHFPTFAFRELLSSYPTVDSVTIGEPEITFLELADAVLCNRDTSVLYKIAGLALNPRPAKRIFLDSNEGIVNKPEIVINKPRKPVSNPDILPFPYRYDLELSKRRGISTYILASRGCYGKCNFCYLDRFYGEESTWRGRSPENVFNEICNIYRDLDERYFYFADANFFGPGRMGKERACELARLIMDNDLNINFGIECRVNDIEDKSVGILVGAGLKEVFLGVESGSQRSLDRFRKFTTVEDNKNAINILRRYGIEPNYGFIMFEPDSTLSDVRDNLEFLKEMNMLNSPSITAHLLHHRQSLFRGMYDFEMKKVTAGDVSSFKYEYKYIFKDKKVAALSEDVNTFCLAALKELSRKRKSRENEQYLCSYDESDSFSREINERLIEYFEETLCSYE